MTKPMPADAPRLKARPGQGKSVGKRVKHGGERGPLVARARGIDTGSIAGAMQVSEDKPLSQMQKLFVRFWASGETLLSASIKAGYADGGTFAYRMARMPNILKLYNEEKAAYESASNMSRKKVMDMLLESYDHAKLLDEPSSMVSAAREIGKMCGYYEPVTIRHQVSHEGVATADRLNRMDDDALLAFIAEQLQTIQAQQPALPAPEETHDVTDVEPK